MAGTEDYSYYSSAENSPFWIKKNEAAAASPVAEDVDEHLQQWERRLITPPKSTRDMLSMTYIPET